MLAELGLPYEKVLISGRGGDTLKPAFLAMNPAGMLPTLVDNTSGANGFVLGESAAIVTYLGEHYGSGFVPPPTSLDRARYDQWAFYIMTSIEQPIWSIVVMKMSLGDDAPDNVNWH
jgi:glutathione S-transferase